jgi:hypothetical protein
MKVLLTETAIDVLGSLSKGKNKDPVRLKKFAKAMRFLESDAVGHPGLASHRYEDLDARFGERIWESYMENNTPSAWRIWWHFGPGKDEITIVDLGAHP